MAETKPKVQREQVVEALRDVFDPEIPLNVYDLGLVYDIQVDDDNKVYVQMTLTAPGCPVGGLITQSAEWRIAEIDGVEDVQVELVFDPPWSPDLLTEEGKMLLGLD
jgi:FeS assembly SUF system protein